MMKKSSSLSRWIPALCVALFSVAASPVAMAQDGGAARIGYVSLERILRDSPPAKAAQAKLDAEFSKRQKDLADTAARLKPLYDYLEKNGAVMPESDRARRQKELADQDKDFQRRQREYNEDLNQRRNEEVAAVVDRAQKVIKQIAEQEKFDMIFQEAVYVNPRIDITDKVLRALTAQSAGGATTGTAPGPSK